MATQIQHRRGTTAQHSTFTGVVGEVTVDTDKNSLVVHDGTTPGGIPIAKSSDVGVPQTSLTGSAILPSGTTAQRDSTPENGYTRFNSTLTTLEVWYSAAWNVLATTANAVLTTGNQTIAGVKTFSDNLINFTGTEATLQVNGIEALKINQYGAEGYFGHNLLLNSIFEDPVNQINSASRVTTAGAYNFDQWYYGSDLKFYQPIDYRRLSANQIYVLNWEGTATAEYKFATVGSSGIVADGGAWTAISKKGTLTAPADVITGSKFLWIRWTGVDATLATFDKPQLEKGTFATVVKRDTYQQRLFECQFFHERIVSVNANMIAAGFVTSTTGASFSLAYLRKRVAPTITLSAVSDFGVAAPVGAAPVTTLSAVIAGLDRARLDCAVSSGLTAGYGATLRCANSTGWVDISSVI